MGAHSNFVSVESDFYTFLFFVGVVLLFATVVFVLTLVRNYSVMHDKYRASKRKEDARKNKIIRQRTVDNFFENRIQEDLEEYTEVQKQSAKVKKLIELYNFD